MSGASSIVCSANAAITVFPWCGLMFSILGIITLGAAFVSAGVVYALGKKYKHYKEEQQAREASIKEATIDLLTTNTQEQSNQIAYQSEQPKQVYKKQTLQDESANASEPENS